MIFFGNILKLFNFQQPEITFSVALKHFFRLFMYILDLGDLEGGGRVSIFSEQVF